MADPRRPESLRAAVLRQALPLVGGRRAVFPLSVQARDAVGNAVRFVYARGEPAVVALLAELDGRASARPSGA